MTSRAWGAILQLDPVVDRHEYNTLIHQAPVLAGEPERVPELLRSVAGADGDQLAERLENLEVFAWQIWARDNVPATESSPSEPRRPYSILVVSRGSRSS